MKPRRSLVLVTVDCLRADHCGFLGYHRPTTPTLDGIAEESLVFNQALVAGTPTYHSFPAIMASRYPLALGRDILGLAPEEPSLATMLAKVGYATGGFIAGNPYLSRRFGYSQGFEVFWDNLVADEMSVGSEPMNGNGPLRRRVNQAIQRHIGRLPPAKTVYDEMYFRYCHWLNEQGRDGSMDALRKYPAGDAVVDDALKWLGNVDKHFFLWLHLMDPHHPYYPPKKSLETMQRADINSREAVFLNGMWSRDGVSDRRLHSYCEKIIALYDAGIRWVDIQIGRLVSALRAANHWDDAVFVVTADHGEEFLEHGGRYHSPPKLTEDLVHVPLLVRIPDAKGGRVDAPFSLLHLVPTLMDILEQPVADSVQGCSYWPALQAGQGWNEPAIIEAIYGCTNPLRMDDRIAPRLLAVRGPRFKLVLDFANQRESLFDLRADPGEQHPLADSERLESRRNLLEVGLEHLRNAGNGPYRGARARARLAEIRQIALPVAPPQST